jgi:hypothetical protein
MGWLGEEGGKGRGGARRDSRGGAGSAGCEVRKKKRKGERDRPTSGPQASARAKKKKKRGRERGPARGKDGGLLGRLGRKVRR